MPSKKSIILLVALSLIFPCNMVLTSAETIQSREQQLQKFQGKVLDEAGEPIIGAFVVEVGNESNGTITETDGSFSLNIAVGKSVRVSCIGYTDALLAVGSENNVTIVLTEDTTFLDEVVVIGYGTAKRSSLTGALSQVSDDAFKDQKVTRIDQALQGRASGIQVSNTGGAPGSEVRIRIRGANSILGDNSPLFVIDGFVGANFNDINPNDIKSIEILKDASSTAIYGSRGANGVVLITTKSGEKNGKVNLSYDGSVSIANTLGRYDTLDAGEFVETANSFNIAKGGSAIFSDSEVAEYKAMGKGYDYQDMVFRTAVSHQHQISLSGGNENTQYRVSGNFLDQQGIIHESGYTRYSVRANLNSKINDRLSMRFLANGIVADSKNNAGNYSGTSNVLTQALAWAPITDPYDENGGYTITDPYGSVKGNPLAMMYDHESLSKRTTINVLGGASYEIIDGLTLDFQAVADLAYVDDKTWSGDYNSNYKPSASKSSSRAQTIQTTTQLSYNNEFGKHSINAVAAFETQRYKYRDLTGSATNLTFAYVKYDNLALAESTTTSSSYSMWSLLSYVGRINYAYDNRYLLSVSVRRDGSSKFSGDNKYSTFPAVAAAWNAHNEQFMKKFENLSTLKIRASWGETGSQAISPYSTLDSYDTGRYYYFNNGTQTSGIAISNPGNPELVWETTEQIDLGVEVGILKDRFRFEADVFKKDTRDLLMNKAIPYYMGGGSITSNVGSIRNTGFDITLSGDIISKKDLSWNSQFNFSFVKNKVRDLGDNEYITSYSDFIGLQNGIPEFIYMEGKSLGSIYGLKYLGTWKEDEASEAAEYGCVPGDAKYEDLDGDYAYNGNDAQIIGCGMPKYTLGWNNTIRYKRFTINAFFQGVLDQDKLNYTRFMGIAGMGDWHAPILAEAKDVWTTSNTDAYLPSYSPTSKWIAQSSMFLENASFVRLKNLSVSYDFDVKKVGSFTVSVNATNLFTITEYKGIDPESSNVGGDSSDIRQGVDFASYPNSRQFILGLSIRF